VDSCREGQECRVSMEPMPETEAVFAKLAAYGDTEVAETLAVMGRRSLVIVPDCVGLSLLVVADGLTYTLVASDERFASLDAIQYFDEGPANAVVESREPVEMNTESLLNEGRWLAFARATSATGIASTLSLPLVRRGIVMGAVNLYAATPDAFNGHHQELAEALGASAESAISNADLTFSTRLEAANAPQELADQYDIDGALGIIAGNHGLDIEAAKTRLSQAAARAGITEAQAARVLKSVYESRRL
jgi:GAF domain-containing protein